MSAISDFAAKQTAYNTDISARLDAIQTEITALNTEITALNTQITTLQNSPGTISPADQATLDGLVTTGASLQAKADALVALPTPVVPVS